MVCESSLLVITPVPPLNVPVSVTSVFGGFGPLAVNVRITGGGTIVREYVELMPVQP